MICPASCAPGDWPWPQAAQPGLLAAQSDQDMRAIGLSHRIMASAWTARGALPCCLARESDHEIAAQPTVARKLGRLGDPVRPYRSVVARYRWRAAEPAGR